MIYVLSAICVSALAYYGISVNFREKYDNILNAIFLFIIAAAKSIELSPVDDLINYKNLFLDTKFLSYSHIIELGRKEEIKDPVFSIVAKFFNELGFNVEQWLGFIALLFAVCFCYFVYKNSKNSWLSLLILFTLHFSFTLTGLRQTMALAFICLAFNFMLQKKPILFYISVVFAILFHSSAILFLPAYFLSKQRINFKQIIYVLAAILVANFFPGFFRNLIEQLAWTEQVSGYSESMISLSWSGFIIEFLILVFCLFVRNNHLKDADLSKVDMLINCLIISICFLALSTVVAEAFRLSLYYSIGSTVLIPNMIALEKGKNRRAWMIIITLALIMYLFWSSAYANFVFFK